MAERVWSVWELLQSLRIRAKASGRDVIDLGQGTPVDETPAVVHSALRAAADAPGYPPAHGTRDLRAAYSDWVHRRWGAALDPADVVATVGSKELIATLPWMLGLGGGDVVVVPELAYPTYAAGATMAGCTVVPADSLTALGPSRVALIWINTPGNPKGNVLPDTHLAKVVAWARERDAIVVSDECYIELTADDERAPSILSPRVCGGRYDHLLAVHSLSKRSSMAGYRCGFVSGDSEVLRRLLKRRRDAGLIVPGPVQAAGVAALADDEHVAEIRQRYARRRALLRGGLVDAGFSVEQSEAGLFLWATNGADGDRTAEQFANLGVLVAPGGFYGASGKLHVRLSLAVADEALTEVLERIRGWRPGIAG